MAHIAVDDVSPPSPFGRRRIKPHAYIADQKRHIRAFLGEALEDRGFVVGEGGSVLELEQAMLAHAPDLLVLGFSGGGMDASKMLETLALNNFAGQVLPIGPRHAPVVSAVQNFGRRLGLAMLPLLATPFSDQGLHDSIAPLIPDEPVPDAPVDVGEALAAGWLELWYQPRVDIRSYALTGAEALVRMRHPAWGVVLPSRFIPDIGDPHFTAFSTFVLKRAIDDWFAFLPRCGAVRLSINLPLAFFKPAHAVAALAQQLPAHPAFQNMTIELAASEVADDIDFANAVAHQLRFHNISAAIDNLGTELASCLALGECHFAEIKIDPALVSGCVENPLKRTLCRQIVDFADSHHARTVASGIETWAELTAMRDIGVDQAQGFLFARPMAAQRFLRDVPGRVSFGPPQG